MAVDSELPKHQDGIIRHADGTQTSYIECGRADGAPLLIFHPLQANRFWALIFDGQALFEGFHIIALDRPGYGSSTPAPHRRVTDWPPKVAEAAEQLGIDKFSILAASAGAMYALACAVADVTRHRIVGKITLLGPWVPPSQWPAGFRMPLMPSLGRWLPVLLLRVFHAHVLKHSAAVVLQGRLRELMVTRTDAELEAFFSHPAWEVVYTAMVAENARAGAGGIITELTRCCMERGGNRLGFLYTRDVAAPVRIFAGQDDAFIPLGVLQHWAQHGRHVELIAIARGTHDGIVATHGPSEALLLLALDLGLRPPP